MHYRAEESRGCPVRALFGRSYTYDSNGNLTNAAPYVLKWDAENRLVDYAARSVKFEYDASSLRVRRTKLNGSDVVYVFSGAQTIAEYTPGADATSPSKQYVYLGGQLLASKDSAGTYTFFERDHLSIRGILADATPNSPREQGHLPFGESWYGTGNKWNFTSYERDSDVGDDFAVFRRYQYANGRFNSPDHVQGSLDNPQSLNRYTYALNAPTTYIDPLGLQAAVCVNLGYFNPDNERIVHTGVWCFGDGGGGGAPPQGEDGGGGNPNQVVPSNTQQHKCPSKLAQSIYLSILRSGLSGLNFAIAEAAAKQTGLTVGYGAGGALAAGFGNSKIFGYSISASAQVVVDPHGNVGLALSYGAGGALGSGVVAGGQFMVSRADSIWGLNGASAGFGAAYGETYGGAVDVSNNGGGALTVTGGFAWGGFGVAGGAGPTKVITLACGE